MYIKIRRVEAVTILDVNGALYIGKAERAFRETVQKLMESGTRHLAINFAAVPKLDSSGISVLVRTHTSIARAGGRCCLFAATENVLQTLRLVRLDTVLDLFPDEASALASF